MHPNLFIHEYLMFERHQELQREMAELRMVAGLHRHHVGVLRRLAWGVETILLALGTRLQGLGSSGKQVLYEQSKEQ